MILLIAVLVFSTYLLNAQYSPALEDNSIIIEEAYNQEDGVVQHIFKGFYSRQKDLELAFSEEVPLFSELHQFSFEITYLSIDAAAVKGIGDLTLQYRYQLTGKESWAVLAPAVSLIIPLGSRNVELGTDNTGYKLMIPASKRLTEYFTAHFNAGAVYFPETGGGSLTEYFAGSSLIWLANTDLNFLIEYMLSYSKADGDNSGTSGHMIVPAVRYALNMGSLQIVPALAALFDPGQSSFEQYVLYLSFEHPL